MIDELGRLHQVIDWQRAVLRSLRIVLAPDTHMAPLKDMRAKTFGVESFIIKDTDEWLHEQQEVIASSLQASTQLIPLINELTEIAKDDHNRAIFVFTVVTVIFLPLGFLAAYLSMSDGPFGDNWNETQSLFWQIAAPLTVGIGSFCLAMAWQESQVQNARGWVSKRIERWRAQYLPFTYKTRREALKENDSMEDADDD
ncbi:hypothetical protein B0I35DRAFT_163812 [Stachybotrys elegans]|uniref:Uncharacterized protein n=1 Tax=Stachybotrys elegans TaxID=80388 RepID=A0A8K0SXE0_9HYPO|nr:hypothetical protein B0I35DRAFT_163812 [Stachybotrys elegans]